jgi:hypothetical protein
VKAHCIAKCFDNVRYYNEGEVYDVDEKTLAQLPSAFVKVDVPAPAAAPVAEDLDPDLGGGVPPPEGPDPAAPNADAQEPPMLTLTPPAQNPSAETPAAHGLVSRSPTGEALEGTSL